MPDSAIAKTASAPRPRILWLLAGAGLALLAVTWLVVDSSRHATLQTGGRTITLERAAHPAARQKGLSDRSIMAENHGMLFVFARDQAGCFWMQGMRFPLDIIWLDAGKQVTQVAAHLSPATYPRTFCPPQPSTYVIELNAGMAQKLGITPGHTLMF